MRPNSLPLAIVAVAALAGCASFPRVDNAEPARPPALKVWIGYPVGSSFVHPIFVNREAHVAMFEIVPGRGVTMVYPRFRDQTLASDMHYADLFIQLGRGYYLSDPFGFANFQPRYYYAVASIAPLNLARLQASLGATRRVLGRMYGSYRPYDVIDRLTELVVPMQPDEEWATDLFVDWPSPPRLATFVAFQTIRCANGRMLRVDPGYPYMGCPGDSRLAVVASSPSPTKPVREIPVDSLRRPRDGDRRRPIQLSEPTGERSRRAEAGARPPRAGRMTRPPSEQGAVRYSGDRPAPTSGGEPSRAPTTEPVRSSDGSARPQPADRGEPRAQPAPERESSGRERKPQ